MGDNSSFYKKLFEDTKIVTLLTTPVDDIKFNTHSYDYDFRVFQAIIALQKSDLELFIEYGIRVLMAESFFNLDKPRLKELSIAVEFCDLTSVILNGLDLKNQTMKEVICYFVESVKKSLSESAKFLSSNSDCFEDFIYK